MTLNLTTIRNQFPALNRPAIFFDNPGGTQIAKPSLDRINKYLLECNANHEGAFATSVASDAILHEAHQAMADFYNAPSPDEIVLTRLDHDANVTPWMLAAQDKGVKMNWVDFDAGDGR